ncbi:MAG: hypothetical protein ACI4CT_06635 [Lachnospiraceae bacterium]
MKKWKEMWHKPRARYYMVMLPFILIWTILYLKVFPFFFTTKVSGIVYFMGIFILGIIMNAVCHSQQQREENHSNGENH